MFQFHIGAIRSLKIVKSSQYHCGFNSILVQLEADVREGMKITVEGFNSILVQLEVFCC